MPTRYTNTKYTKKILFSMHSLHAPRKLELGQRPVTTWNIVIDADMKITAWWVGLQAEHWLRRVRD